jgi:hypothetical protein
MHNAKNIHTSAHRCFSGLIGPPKEDAPAESDRTQHNADKPSHNLTGHSVLEILEFAFVRMLKIAAFYYV